MGGRERTGLKWALLVSKIT